MSSDNYYQILNVAENASQEKIAMVYYVGLKRLQTIQQEKPHLTEYIEQAIARLRQAYQILSDPQFRAVYDKSLKEKTPFISPILYTSNQPDNIENPPKEETKTVTQYNTKKTTLLDKKASKQQKKPRRSFLTIIILICCLIIGIAYYIYQNFLWQEPKIKDKTNTNTKIIDPKSSLNEKLKKAELLKQQNAYNPQLKAIANEIAKAANTKNNIIINNSMQFVGARASNQNITYRFIVFDNITDSQQNLLSFFTDRFTSDSNEVCNSQQLHLSNGILFTLAYFNSKGQLVGSYYIDQQVCDIRPQKLIKKPDINQLNSVEATVDTPNK